MIFLGIFSTLFLGRICWTELQRCSSYKLAH